MTIYTVEIEGRQIRCGPQKARPQPMVWGATADA